MECIDVCYKKVGELSLLLNVYPPDISSLRHEARSNTEVLRLPTVVYFHGGGLTVGSRNSWFPSWLQARLNAAGMVLVSVDYQLIPGPATVHNVIDDIQDVFAFLRDENTRFKSGEDLEFGIRPDAMAAAGSSAGGLCALLAGIHVSPKPKAVLALYAVGGDSFTHQTLSPKTKPFFLGREMLDPADFPDLLYPGCQALQPICDSPLEYYPLDHPTKPGWPSNPRTYLSRLYLQLGQYLDYWTGQHEPSLSATLRPLLDNPDLVSDPFAMQDAAAELIPEHHRRIFPQLHVTSDFPPTYLFHGADDTAVPPSDSRHFYMLLQMAGVAAHLVYVPGATHSLDYVKNAEELYAHHFDEMNRFLVVHLDV